MSQDREHAHRAWRTAERLKTLSDGIVRIGPWGLGLGLDGLLAFVPGANLLYGLSAGAILVAEGVRAKASPLTLARMLGYLAIDNATDAVPVAGWAVDFLFPGHLLAARALQKDIEARHGPSTLGDRPLWRRKARTRARGVTVS